MQPIDRNRRASRSRSRGWTALLALVMLLSVFAAPAQANSNAINANQYFPGLNEQTFRYFMPGIIRPDEGSMEFTVRLNTPTSQFGGTWNFLFWNVGTSASAGNTQLAIHMPQLPEKGLKVHSRSDLGAMASIADTAFDTKMGQRQNIAITWGSQMKLYVNGELKGTSPYHGGWSEQIQSYLFTIEKGGIFYPEQVRISTKERTQAELSASPEAKFKADADTSLLIKNDFKTLQRTKTNWHKTSNYATLLPALREDKQIFTQGEQVVLPYMSINYSSAPIDYTVEVTATDHTGATVATKQYPVTVQPGGQYRIHELPFSELNNQGYYAVSMAVKQGATTRMTKTTNIAVLSADDNTIADGALKDYLGTHHDNLLNASIQKKLGVDHIRSWGTNNPFGWFIVEPKKGVFDWSKADEYVAEAKKHGLKVLPVLGYPPEWAAEYPTPERLETSHADAKRPDRWAARDMQEWGNYVYQLVSRYKDDIEAFEIWNEVNFLKGSSNAAFNNTPEKYYEMLQVAYTNAKLADPDAKVLTSGLSDNPGADTTMQVYLAGKTVEEGYYDIMNLHGYFNTYAPTIDLLKQTRPGAEYWMTEYGALFDAFGFDRSFKEVEWPINYLAAGFSKFYLFAEYSRQINRNEASPMLGYYTTAVFQNQLRKTDSLTGKYTGFPNAGSFNTAHHLLRTDGKTLSIIGAKTGDYNVTVNGSVEQVLDMYGKPVPVTVSGGQSTFRVLGQTYVISAAPLTITATVSNIAQVSMLSNGGFESNIGDFGADPQGTVSEGWSFQENNPDTDVVLSTGGDGSTYGMKVTTAGGQRVTFTADSAITQKGKYTLTARYKLLSGNALKVRPFTFVKNQDTGAETLAQLAGTASVSANYATFTISFVLTEDPVLPIQVGGGLLAASEAGSVIFDNFVLTYLGPES